MNILFAIVLIAIFGGLGVAKVAAVPAMRKKAHDLRFSVPAYRAIGVLELAGAAGVAIGLAASPLGYAAGGGLVLLMLGAVGAHLANRHGPRDIALPLLVGAVAVGYLLTLG